MKITAIRLAYGSLLLAVPAALLRACGGPADRPALIYARVLGARQLAEGTLLLGRDESAWPLGGAVVDAIHGLSAVALAAHTERYRRLALLNAASAAALAFHGARSARRR